MDEKKLFTLKDELNIYFKMQLRLCKIRNSLITHPRKKHDEYLGEHLTKASIDSKKRITKLIKELSV